MIDVDCSCRSATTIDGGRGSHPGSPRSPAAPCRVKTTLLYGSSSPSRDVASRARSSSQREDRARPAGVQEKEEKGAGTAICLRERHVVGRMRVRDPRNGARSAIEDRREILAQGGEEGELGVTSGEQVPVHRAR